MNFVDMVDSQIIASVQKEKDLETAIHSKPNIVFLITGNLTTMEQYIEKLRAANKEIFIHLEFIDGLSNSKSALEFVAKQWKPTGIITTKNHLIKHAKDLGLLTVQRIFLLDGNAVSKGIEMVSSSSPDAVEVMPGVIPKVIDKLARKLPYPIISGGLINSESEVLEALQSGALAISSGNPKMWELDL